MFKHLASLLTIMCLALMPMMTSCHSSRHSVRGDQGSRYDDRDDIYGGRDHGRHNNERNEGEAPEGDGLRRALRDYAMKFVGSPYRYGGNDRSGFDCSGLVCRVYLDIAHFKLPRNSAEQGEFCRRISKGKLKAGDLLFFTGKRGGSGRVSHVGIYIGKGKMVHASSSCGVIVSSIDDDYWGPRLHHCGRVGQLFR